MWPSDEEVWRPCFHKSMNAASGSVFCYYQTTNLEIT